MKKIKVAITVPEFENRKDYFEQIVSVSPRLEVEQRISRSILETAELLEDAEILYTLWIPAHLKNGNKLKWVQMTSTGIDNKLDKTMFDPERKITVTNAAGCHAVAIGEYSLFVMGLFARGFLQFRKDQQMKIRDRNHSTLTKDRKSVV